MGVLIKGNLLFLNQAQYGMVDIHLEIRERFEKERFEGHNFYWHRNEGFSVGGLRNFPLITQPKL